MTPLEQLRLATALAHSVPAAILRMCTDNGDTIVVGAHPAADMDACTMRQVVQAFSCPANPDYSERISGIEFGGSLNDLDGGVFAVNSFGIEQRWVASLLGPDRLAELLDDVGLDAVPEDALHGCLKPDPALGVTLLVVTANSAAHVDQLDALASKAAAAIFVEELRCAVSRDAYRTPLPDPLPRGARGHAMPRSRRGWLEELDQVSGRIDGENL